MARQTTLPPLHFGDAGQSGTPDAPPARARGEGDNLVPAAHRDLLRSTVQRIRAERATIAAANAAIADAYRSLRGAGLNPGIVKKVVNRLELTREERALLEERDELLRIYWDVVEDLTVAPGADDAEG